MLELGDRLRVGALACFLGCVTFCGRLDAQTRYELLDLGALNGTTTTSLSAINDSGVIVGHSNVGGLVTSVATLWLDGRARSLGTLVGGHYSEATDISSDGVAVGSSTVETIAGQLAIQDATAVSFDNFLGSALESSPGVALGWQLSYAQGVNTDGWIIGWGFDGSIRRSFVYDGSQFRRVGPRNWVSSTVTGINGSGQVVGESTRRNQFGPLPFLWDDGVITDLPVASGQWGRPADVNDFGWVAGEMSMNGHRSHAVLWRDGERLDLGTFGGRFSAAMAVNEFGLVVGWAHDASNKSRMFVWRDGVMVDPTRSLVGGDGNGIPGIARDINIAGQIIGSLEGFSGGVVLSPVDFEMSEVSPGVAGEVNRIVLTGLEPGKQVHLLYGTEPGMTVIPRCEGARVMISQPLLGGSSRADDFGMVVLERRVPQSVRGSTLLIQAIQRTACKVSNVVTVRFD